MRLTSDNSTYFIESDAVDLFWQFSIRFYQQNDIKSALHQLQDKEALNINRVLLGCWLTEANLGLAESARIKSPTISQLENWLVLIRQLRNQLKARIVLAASQDAEYEQWKQYRERTLNSELKLEKHHQKLLISILVSKIQIANNTSRKFVDFERLVHKLTDLDSDKTARKRRRVSQQLQTLYNKLN